MRFLLSHSTWVPKQKSLFPFAYRAITFFGRTFQTIQLKNKLVTFPRGLEPPDVLAPQPHTYNASRLSHTHGLGSFHFARRYYGNRISFFSYMRVLRCFNSPRIAHMSYEFRHTLRGSLLAGLPHSDISGSKLVCSSPKLIAAYHVLHRLPAPNHPPYALSSLTKNNSFSVLFSNIRYLTIVKEHIY